MHHTLNSVYQLGKQALANITAEHWQGAIRLAIKHEEMYLSLEQPPPSSEPMQEAPQSPEPDQQPGPSNAELPMEVESAFKCHSCKITWKKAKTFANHVKSYEKCSKCQMIFCGMNRQRRLRGHIQREHSEKKSYQCPICPKGFKNPSLLKRHLLWSSCGRQEMPKDFKL